jgi:hypothetical protein
VEECIVLLQYLIEDMAVVSVSTTRREDPSRLQKTSSSSSPEESVRLFVDILQVFIFFI